MRTEDYPLNHVTDFTVGLEYVHSFVIDAEDLARFAIVSGDAHPLHSDSSLARERGLPSVPVHGMLVASRSSAFVARDVIGTHGFLASVTADFRHPVYCGDELVWRAKVVRVVVETGLVELSWHITNERLVVVQRGTACAVLPLR